MGFAIAPLTLWAAFFFVIPLIGMRFELSIPAPGKIVQLDVDPLNNWSQQYNCLPMSQFSAWEVPFSAKVMSARNEEAKILKKTAAWQVRQTTFPTQKSVQADCNIVLHACISYDC